MTREDLKEYKYNQEWIKGRLEYIEEYRTSITNITSVISDMPKSSREVQDSMAEKIAELIDMVNELLDDVLEENKKQKKITDQLKLVEQPYRLILDKMYIQGKSLVVVASEMNYTYEYIRKANGTALKKFEEVTKSYWKAHINCDNIYNEKRNKVQATFFLTNKLFFDKSRCFKCLLFYYWIRIINKKAVAIATKYEKTQKILIFQ